MPAMIGLGGGPLGALAADDAVRLVHGALDLGVRFFDVARSYGDAEARLGAALSSWPSSATTRSTLAAGGAPDDVVVATKGGYGVDGAADWTPECVARGVDEARRRLRRDVLDVFFLHSCDAATTERVAPALVDAVAAGRVRAAGYSGDGDALDRAVRDARFAVVECSVSPVDQAALADAIPTMRRRDGGVGGHDHVVVDDRGDGGHDHGPVGDRDAGRRAAVSGADAPPLPCVVAKRALMNAAFRFDARPDAHDVGAYWDRLHAMRLPQLAADAGLPLDALCVRFAAHAPGVDVVLVGTSSLERLARAVRLVDDGPLPDDVLRALRTRFDAAWPGVI